MINNNNQKKNYWSIAAIFIFTFFAYSPAMKGGFIWDDKLLIVNNELLRTFDGLKTIWTAIKSQVQYYPLTLTTFWIDYNTWQLNPMGFHLTNVALHAFNAIILWFILKRLQIPGAWFAAAVFALHPVNVESVAWITQRKNVLSAFFYLLSLLTYIKFFRQGSTGKTTDSSPSLYFSGGKALSSKLLGLYIASLILYLFAILSKPVTCTLPAVILLVLWWKNNHIRRQDALLLLPYFLIALIFGLNTIWLEKHSGSVVIDYGFSLIERCLIAGRALWFYAGKLIWPFNLSFIYSRWHIDAGVWWQYLFPLAAIVIFITFWSLRNRIGRGPFVAISLFAGTLLPLLGFIDVYYMRYSFVADHWQYLASIGLLVPGCAWITNLFHRSNNKLQIVIRFACIVLLTTLGTLVWHQAHIYRNGEALWRDTLAKNPNTWLGHNNLATYLERIEKYDEAIIHYSEALRISPNEADTHYNLGNVYTKNNMLDLAIIEYKKAVFLKPNFPEAYYNLGIALGEKGLHEMANQAMRRSMSISSPSKGAWKIRPDNQQN